MHHGYEVEVAIEYGIEEAILINHFAFWINTNAAQGVNYIDGRFWTFNTKKGLLNALPELKTARVVRYAIDKLVENGIIILGQYSKNNLDKTTWYAFSDKGLEMVRKYNLGTVDFAIVQNRRFETTKLSAPCDEIVKRNTNKYTIEDSNNKDNNIVQPDLFGGSDKVQVEAEVKKKVDYEFQFLWDIYGKKKNRQQAENAWKKLSAEERKEVLEKTPEWVKADAARPDFNIQFRPYLSTYINQERWKDELETPQNGTDTSTGSCAGAQRVHTANRQQFGNAFEQLANR